MALCVLTGTPTAPTAAAGTSTSQIATTAFVSSGLLLKQTEMRFFKQITNNYDHVGR